MQKRPIFLASILLALFGAACTTTGDRWERQREQYQERYESEGKEPPDYLTQMERRVYIEARENYQEMLEAH